MPYSCWATTTSCESNAASASGQPSPGRLDQVQATTGSATLGVPSVTTRTMPTCASARAARWLARVLLNEAKPHSVGGWELIMAYRMLTSGLPSGCGPRGVHSVGPHAVMAPIHQRDLVVERSYAAWSTGVSP